MSPADCADVAGTSGDGGGEGAAVDGRRLRRTRKIGDSNAAILQLLEDGVPVTMLSVARQADLALRSVYRLYDDLDRAVEEIKAERYDGIVELWNSRRPPPPDSPLDERIAAIVDQRLELERFGRPLRHTERKPSSFGPLDDEVSELFGPELSVLDDRSAAERSIQLLLRPRNLRAVVEVESDRAVLRSTLGLSIRRLLQR